MLQNLGKIRKMPVTCPFSLFSCAHLLCTKSVLSTFRNSGSLKPPGALIPGMDAPSSTRLAPGSPEGASQGTKKRGRRQQVLETYLQTYQASKRRLQGHLHLIWAGFHSFSKISETVQVRVRVRAKTCSCC